MPKQFLRAYPFRDMLSRPKFIIDYPMGRQFACRCGMMLMADEAILRLTVESDLRRSGLAWKGDNTKWRKEKGQ